MGKKVIYLPNLDQDLHKTTIIILINQYHVNLFCLKPYLWNKTKYNKSFSYDQREFQHLTKSRNEDFCGSKTCPGEIDALREQTREEIDREGKGSSNKP